MGEVTPAFDASDATWPRARVTEIVATSFHGDQLWMLWPRNSRHASVGDRDGLLFVMPKSSWRVIDA